MAHPSPSGNVEAHVQGDVSGQVAVGNYILQIGSVHGGVVNVASPGQESRLRMRPTPVALRPRPFPGLLNRETEINAANAALQSALPVEFYAQAGLGKTALLRHLAHHPLDATFPDGVVYLSARHQPLPDLLQSLVDAFYESDVPVKATDAQVRHALLNRQALILLDDVELGREKVEALMDAAPRCAFLLASAERCLWGEGRAMALGGLPTNEALALVERELGRPLTPEERLDAQSLCAALDGHPLRILQAVAIAQGEGRSLEEVARQVQAPAPGEALTGQIIESLSEPQRQLLSALAVLGGAPVSAEDLSALTGLSDVIPVLEKLQGDGLVQAHSPRYSLTGTLEQDLRQAWDLVPWAERALAHFTAWAEARQQTPERLVEGTQAILQTIEWGFEAGRWQEALRLGWAVESALVLGGQWEAWRRMLNLILQAARTLSNQAVEAWALHQLGSRALCLGDVVTARTSLGEALRLRETLGDQAGGAITGHNLGLLAAPPPPSQPPSQTRPTPPSGASSTPGVLWLLGGAAAFLAVLVLVVGGLVSVLLLRPTPTLPPPITVVTSTPSSTAVPTHTPTPTSRSTSTSTSMPTPTHTPTGSPTPTYTSTPTIPPDTEGPGISRITESDDPIYWPPYCTPDQVTISALVSDPSGVSGVKLSYRVVGGRKEGDWQALPMKQVGTDTYGATVGDDALRASLDPPSVGAPATLEYYVQAFDDIGNRSQSPTGTLKIEYCVY